jgi:hypothetical protein
MPARAGTIACSLLAALLLVAASFGSAGCGEEDLQEVPEGLAFELGDLEYKALFSRFLNINDTEDRAYLQGQPPPPPGQLYLGVFLEVENIGDEVQSLPALLTVIDTEETVYESIPFENDFTLELGGRLASGEEAPELDSPAASGPIKGAMILFLVEQSSTENRPLELEIPGEDESARIELDI